MPNYKTSNMGEFVHSEVSLPTTLEHISQFLGYMSAEVWEQIQTKAEELKTEKSKKIKRSSLTKITKSSPREFAAAIVKEFVREEEDDDFIIAGGVHDALMFILVNLVEELGADTVDSWIGLEMQSTPVTEGDRASLIMLEEMYENYFADEINDFARLPEFDTQCSAVWFDGKMCVLTVGAPCKRMRDIAKISEVDSKPLKTVLKRFCDEYTNIPMFVATHSYGYQLFMECIERPKVEALLAFNPHSLKPFSHHPFKTKFFDNLTDTTCKSCNLSDSNLQSAVVCVAYTPDYTCSLQQWKVRIQVRDRNSRVFVV
jgi:hypothetical protein